VPKRSTSIHSWITSSVFPPSGGPRRRARGRDAEDVEEFGLELRGGGRRPHAPSPDRRGGFQSAGRDEERGDLAGGNHERGTQTRTSVSGVSLSGRSHIISREEEEGKEIGVEERGPELLVPHDGAGGASGGPTEGGKAIEMMAAG